MKALPIELPNKIAIELDHLVANGWFANEIVRPQRSPRVTIKINTIHIVFLLYISSIGVESGWKDAYTRGSILSYIMQ